MLRKVDGNGVSYDGEVWACDVCTIREHTQRAHATSSPKSCGTRRQRPGSSSPHRYYRAEYRGSAADVEEGVYVKMAPGYKNSNKTGEPPPASDASSCNHLRVTQLTPQLVENYRPYCWSNSVSSRSSPDNMRLRLPQEQHHRHYNPLCGRFSSARRRHGGS